MSDDREKIKGDVLKIIISNYLDEINKISFGIADYILDREQSLTEKIKELEESFRKKCHNCSELLKQVEENEKLKAEIIKLTENHSKLTESGGGYEHNLYYKITRTNK